MKRTYPDYYQQFRCIADRCGHNCCVGWEIDIDGGTLRRYLRMKGPMGERLRQSIEITADGASFAADAEGRCPLLNANGLCDLIADQGEKALCQICRDHPRFRNRLRDREEIGLGLCCEAACRLILGNGEKPGLITEDDGRSKAAPGGAEQRWLDARDQLLDLIWTPALDIDSCLSLALSRYYGIGRVPYTSRYWSRFFLSMEHMEPSWIERLKKLHDRKSQYMTIPPSDDDGQLRRLATYFIYRYAVHGWKRRRSQHNSCVAFAALSVYMIYLIGKETGDLYEAARQYSAEIEYSDINVEKLLDKFDRYAEEYI